MYDATGAFIGRMKDPFRDEAGVLSSYLNTGTVLRTGGASNTILVGTSQMVFQTGKSIKDVDNLHVVLFDGRQYKGTSTPLEIDSQSISAVKTVASGPSQ